MASGIQADILDFCDAAKFYLTDEVEQLADMYGFATPCSHPSIKQIERDIDTLGRAAFLAARQNQTPAIKRLLVELEDAITKLSRAREWEMHHMTWTIHEWHMLVGWPSQAWGGIWHGPW